MDFEHFEGFKRIKNTRNLTAEKIVELIKTYEKNIGEIDLDNNIIDINSEGKYSIEIRVIIDEIVIEVKNDNVSENNQKIDISEEKKDLELVRTNRIIEQLYDLINDYTKNGVVKEHITAAKEILHMKESENFILGGAFSVGKRYDITNSKNQIVYEINESKIGKLFSIKNNKTNREDVVVRYENAANNEFLILKQPFERIDMEKDIRSIKTVFKGFLSTKEVKVSADYTDNHFLVELDEIVIGAIDCLDPSVKKEYNLEINDLNYEYLIVSLAVMIDIFSLNN